MKRCTEILWISKKQLMKKSFGAFLFYIKRGEDVSVEIGIIIAVGGLILSYLGCQLNAKKI